MHWRCKRTVLVTKRMEFHTVRSETVHLRGRHGLQQKGGFEMTSPIPVTILSMGFGRDMRAIPRRMELNGRPIDFIDNGLCTTVRKGDRVAQILALSDGSQTFHLRSENRGGTWTLIGIN